MADDDEHPYGEFTHLKGASPEKGSVEEFAGAMNSMAQSAGMDWDEEKAAQISEWFKANPVLGITATKGDTNTKDEYSIQGLDPWFERVQKTNIALAEAYGVPVNELGMSVGPAVAQITQKNRQVSLEMGPMKQQGYLEHIQTHPEDELIEAPQVMKQKLSKAEQVALLLSQLPEDKLDKILSGLVEEDKKDGPDLGRKAEDRQGNP